MKLFLMSLTLVVASAAGGTASAARVGAGTGCGTTIGTFPTVPHKRPIATPPAPGLSVTQIAPHKFRLHWWFLSMPANCRPVWIILRVDESPGPNPPFGPNSDLKVTRSSGTYILNVPTFIKPVRGSASALDAIGARSLITFVPIHR